MIDVHAHASSPSAATLAEAMPGFASQRAATAARYRDPRTADYMRQLQPRWDRDLSVLDARLAFMDRTGTNTQLVSVNPGQYYYWADRPEADALVTAVQDDLAQLVATAPPGRLLALATLALQHPALAAEQLRAAMTRPGFVGVQISTNAGGRDLSDPLFEDVWAAAEETSAVVFLHPLGCPQLTGRLAPSYLNNIIGQPLETTIALSHLYFTGVLDRHPGLRLVAAHGGGYLPAFLGRSSHAWTVRPDSRSMERSPEEYVRSTWFDSVVHSSSVLRNLVDVAGPDRVVVGTDFPFDMGVEDPRAELATLDADTAAAVRRSNALDLLGPRAGLVAPSSRPI